MTVSPRQAAPAFLQIDAVLLRLSGAQALTEVCRFLRHEFSHYRWVGIYRLGGEELVLAGWDGAEPTEHTQIPLSRGICGRAVRENRTIIVDDVRSDPEYLACFLETRAEIVVPIREGASVLGEIDIDGSVVGAYDVSDQEFLEKLATRLTRPLKEAAAPPPPVR